MDNAVADCSNTLRHVLFFLVEKNEQKQDEARSPTDSTTSNESALTAATQSSRRSNVVQVPAQSTRASSPASQHQTDSGASKPISPLKADVPAFVPMKTVAAPVFEQRTIAGKGFGLFACRDLPQGTRIVREKPLLEISQNNLDLAYHNYLRLTEEQKAAFDALQCYLPSNVDAEQAARVCALRVEISEDDLPGYISEHARVMGIFACNDFQLADGHLGVFTIASRFNHSCVPNVHHTYNPSLHAETMHTIHKIKAGEELLVNYLGPQATYDMRNTRIAQLRLHYNFTCQCIACTDATGSSDLRRELLGGIFHGLNEFSAGTPPDKRFVPDSPQMALTHAEDGIRILMDENLLTVELTKAYRVASTLSLAIYDYDRALEYAFNEEEIERNILGLEVDDLERIGAAAKQWTEEVYLTACGSGHNFKAHFLRQFTDWKQLKVEKMEAKRIARGSMKYQTLNKKKRNYHKRDKKKKHERSPLEQDHSPTNQGLFSPKQGSSRKRVAGEDITPPPTTGENQWT